MEARLLDIRRSILRCAIPRPVQHDLRSHGFDELEGHVRLGASCLTISFFPIFLDDCLEVSIAA